MSLEEKEKAIKLNRACFRCFRSGHGSKMCRVAVKCFVCFGNHHTLMCDQHKRDKQHHRDKPEEPKEKLKESNHVPVDDKKTADGHDQTASYVSQVNSHKIILLKTLHVKVIAPAGGWREVRVLFDEGSQRSYNKRSLAEEMGCEKLGQETMTTLLFGGGKKGLQARVKYNVLLGSTNGSNSCYKNNFILLDEPVLCQNVPSIPSGPWIIGKDPVVPKEEKAETTTRSGRKSRPPQRYGAWNK
ncbi:unnamed protein product [Orchesella dallaii]|uniref:Peptidase aspartic putative domain-containing protein n=1 Tax=Orchesella dallaii TaxID=48710 RepID=A0ABP1RVH9_9HEXA